MSRAFAVSMLVLVMLSPAGGAWAQEDDDFAGPAREFFTEDGRQLSSDAEISAYLASLEADKRRRLNDVCRTERATKAHALIELCAWIGQYR
jgi:hypothetical protein